MLTGLYNSSSAMNAAAVRQDIIARNLAHSEMPGFKRVQTTFEAFGRPTNEVEPNRLGTRATITKTDFSPGPLKSTGRKLDLAIAGDGFFQLEGPNGPLLTRNGVFYRNAGGQLINSIGYPVSGANAIPPNIPTEAIKISADGRISANGQQFGQLEIVTVPDTATLEDFGTTLFQAPPGVQTAPADGTIQQGFREQANVTTVTEMVQMLAGMRHHEANSKVMQLMADTLQRHTSKGIG